MVHRRSQYAQKVKGLRAKLFNKKRFQEKAEMKKKITLVPGCAPPNIPPEELTEEFLGPALAWSWKYGGWTTIFLLVVFAWGNIQLWGTFPSVNATNATLLTDTSFDDAAKSI